jgi:transposase
MERNRLGSTRDVDARASIETVIAFLERPKPARCCRGVKKQQVGDLDGQILELVRADSELKTLDVLLQSVPGVGPVVSATLLSSLPELGFATTSRLSALVGVTPMNHERPKPVRCWFRVKKAKKVALVACMRKLIGILNAMVRDRKPWMDTTVPEVALGA